MMVHSPCNCVVLPNHSSYDTYPGAVRRHVAIDGEGVWCCVVLPASRGQEESLFKQHMVSPTLEYTKQEELFSTARAKEEEARLVADDKRSALRAKRANGETLDADDLNTLYDLFLGV